jgi:hypothetical protein
MRGWIDRVACAMAFAACCLTGCASFAPAVPARGVLADFTVDTRVDSPIARYYLEDYRAGRRTAPGWDASIDAIHRDLGDRVPTRTELAHWSRTHSTDFATLVLVRQLAMQPDRFGLRHRFAQALAAVRESHRDGVRDTVAISPRHLFVFVPGWLYRSDPGSGADLALQRAILERHGARTYFAAIDENGAVEDNAAQLVALIRRLAPNEESIVLVSASKGGPEVALALSMLRAAPEATRVTAWVNIGGLLNGTPLADYALRWPICWLVRWAVLPDDRFTAIQSLATARSAQRAQWLHLPEHVLAVDYLGVPLSGQVSSRAREGYALLRASGPNDGLTSLVDEIGRGSAVLIDPGVDHFLRHADIDDRTLALALALDRALAAARIGSR